jgi:hypothetical protein
MLAVSFGILGLAIGIFVTGTWFVFFQPSVRRARRYGKIASMPVSQETRDRACRDYTGDGKGIYAGRTCCPTPPNGAHTGTCKNAIVMCGEERFWVNELPEWRASL